MDLTVERELLLELLDRTVDLELLPELLRETDEDRELLLLTIPLTTLFNILLPREPLLTDDEDETRPVWFTLEERVFTTLSLMLRTACSWLVDGLWKAAVLC